MPHIVLQHSNNIIEKSGFKKLFTDYHVYLAGSLSTEMNRCKSRALEISNYCVGDNDPKHAFIHVDLRILRGRGPDKLRDVGMQLMEITRNHFAESLKNLNTQVTLEISDLQPNYFKFASEDQFVQMI
jgi:5-carboxymethyl-2-hydroxymuconate isomerase